MALKGFPISSQVMELGSPSIPPKRLHRIWVDGQGDRPVVLCPGFQSRKRMFTVFFNNSGPLVVDILPQDTTMTATYYVQNVLSQVKSAINEQRPKVSTSRTLYLHDHAGPHKARPQLSHCGI
ncbi:transposase [Elysia marginata]|uniref:Transposase n=1 Tax=Elysia marginata TaxID=1093978 RepID=A0AAV4FL70_9GAST|nr:transposase [Elysia marginata]